ncbi:MAG TPA: hypothetical protein VFM28_08905 [Nitrososphaeraceae archaeon]|nr:hypothetical protein [Nitrososphaeraceae archaeon]
MALPCWFYICNIQVSDRAVLIVVLLQKPCLSLTGIRSILNTDLIYSMKGSIDLILYELIAIPSLD